MGHSALQSNLGVLRTGILIRKLFELALLVVLGPHTEEAAAGRVTDQCHDYKKSQSSLSTSKVF